MRKTLGKKEKKFGNETKIEYKQEGSVRRGKYGTGRKRKRGRHERRGRERGTVRGGI